MIYQGSWIYAYSQALIARHIIDTIRCNYINGNVIQISQSLTDVLTDKLCLQAWAAACLQITWLMYRSTYKTINHAVIGYLNFRGMQSRYSYVPLVMNSD
jgi:hypothetical protein